MNINYNRYYINLDKVNYIESRFISDGEAYILINAYQIDNRYILTSLLDYLIKLYKYYRNLFKSKLLKSIFIRFLSRINIFSINTIVAFFRRRSAFK